MRFDGPISRKGDLQRQLAREATAPNVEIHPNLAELYRRKVTNLQELLTEEVSRGRAMDVIRTLVDRVEVHTGPKRGQAQVILVGALASILNFANAEKQNAASGGGGVGRDLLVAGVGFEPTTFRL